jgi:hypothetical protein
MLVFSFEAELVHPFSVTGFQLNAEVMAPKKAPKKNEDAHEGDIISDTTPHAIDSIKS